MALAAQDLLDRLAAGDRRIGQERQLRGSLESRLHVDRRLQLRAVLFERDARLITERATSGDVSTPVTVSRPSRSSTSLILISSSEITSRRI
jgi:hypothetical protein